jgi:hypothetical protein
MALGGRIAAALLGVDARYRAESGDDDGLVVLNLAAPDEIAAASFGSYAEAAAELRRLEAAGARLAEPDRCRYYQQVCRSTLAFLEWREHGLPFAARLQAFLGVAAEPVSETGLDRLRGRLRSLLSGMGYSGELLAQCAAWEVRHRVPAEQVPHVLSELLSEAWDRTNRILPIPAPPSDGMSVTAVSGVAFNARCSYAQRHIELNTDPVLTRPGLKHLAAHEGYPGHYVQFKLRETAFRAGRAPADVLLSVVNTASSSVFEGIADHGLALLDWIEDDDDRVQSLLTRYRAGIGTGAAWRLHALGWPAGRVREWLAGESLTGGSGWVANRMAFISAPARAVLIWSYWWGEPVVAGAWAGVPPAHHPEFLRFLYERMHSTDTVGMLPPTISA